MTPDLILTSAILSVGAAVVWVGVTRTAARLLSAVREEWLIAANPSGEESHVAFLDRRVHELADAVARLERQARRQSEQTEARLKSAIEELQTSFFRTLHESHDAESAPLRERLEQLEQSVERALGQLEVVSRVEHLAETVARSQQAVRKLAEQAMKESARNSELHAAEALDRAMARLEERLAGMERAVREGLLAAARAEDVVALSRQVAELQARSEGAEAGSASEAEERARVLEARLEQLSGELESLRGTVAGQEPLPAGQRINAGSPPVAAEDVPGAAEPAVGSGVPKRPRIVSARARERFEEVLRLSEEGLTAEAIAVRTGLDIAEIELMIAGQGPQQGPEGR